MKALKFNSQILLTALLLAGASLSAQEVKKELHEEFSTNKSTVLNIDCKFSDLTLKNWDKDQASFDVTVIAEHKDEAKAKKLIDLITVKFENKGNEIILVTGLDEKISKGDFGDNKKFKIIIVGSVPSYVNLTLDSKFGSVNIGEINGKAEIETSFGSFEADALGNSVNSITASHGDVRIGRMANGIIDTKFGSVHIQDAGNLDIEMNQGDITIGTAGNLSAEFNMGNLKVERIKPSFEEISIEMNMGNIELGIDKDAGFTIEAEVKMGNIDLPKELGKPSEGQNAMKSSFEGKYGNGKSSISLDGNFGNIEIKLK